MSYQVLHVNSHPRSHCIWPNPNHFTTGKSFKNLRYICIKFDFPTPNGSHETWSHFVLWKKPMEKTQHNTHQSRWRLWNWEIQALGRRKQRITPVEITSSQNPSNQVAGRKVWVETVGGLNCRERIHMGVSKNRGTPKWMVYTGKPY